MGTRYLLPTTYKKSNFTYNSNFAYIDEVIRYVIPDDCSEAILKKDFCAALPCNNVKVNFMRKPF